MKYYFLIFTIFLTACGEGFKENSLEGPLKTSHKINLEIESSDLKFDWDNQHKDADIWSATVFDNLSELETTKNLLTTTPKDINKFCPTYTKLNTENRKLFWISLIAAMARFESGFNPKVKYTENFRDKTGKKVISRGLMQLSYESAKAYGCELIKAEDLHDPEKNLNCALRIMDRWVGHDKVISRKVDGSWKGAARYWSVLRDKSIRSQIIKKTSLNSPCSEF